MHPRPHDDEGRLRKGGVEVSRGEVQESNVHYLLGSECGRKSSLGVRDIVRGGSGFTARGANKVSIFPEPQSFGGQQPRFFILCFENDAVEQYNIWHLLVHGFADDPSLLGSLRRDCVGPPRLHIRDFVILCCFSHSTTYTTDALGS